MSLSSELSNLMVVLEIPEIAVGVRNKGRLLWIMPSHETIMESNYKSIKEKQQENLKTLSDNILLNNP